MFHNIPRLGMGCWAIGGPFHDGEGHPLGWGEVDDAVSVRALEASFEAGVRFFDTAAGYGSGHSERLVGQVFGNRDDLVISTKCGFTFDEDKRLATGVDHSFDGTLAQIEASRTRLKRDCIDIMFLHLNGLPIDEAAVVLDALQEARSRGWIKHFGWSTDYPDRAAAWAGQPGYIAVQHALNLFLEVPTILGEIERQDIWSINRSPLAMGLLTGKKYDSIDAKGDVRANNFDWLAYFKGGEAQSSFDDKLAPIRELLTSDGRTLAQGALGWIWARSPKTVPIPGARTPEQAIANARALEFGPLPKAVFDEIEALIDREPEGEPRDR